MSSKVYSFPSVHIEETDGLRVDAFAESMQRYFGGLVGRLEFICLSYKAAFLEAHKHLAETHQLWIFTMRKPPEGQGEEGILFALVPHGEALVSDYAAFVRSQADRFPQQFVAHAEFMARLEELVRSDV